MLSVTDEHADNLLIKKATLLKMLSIRATPFCKHLYEQPKIRVRIRFLKIQIIKEKGCK